MKNRNNTFKKLLVAVGIILILLTSCAFYIADYYHADVSSIEAFGKESNIRKQMIDNGVTAYVPENPAAGFIFYPGGKVEHIAYEPLMLACAEENILCILLKMPGNLAVLDIDAADGIPEKYPEVKNWYIGGHSLGGSMAASHAAKHPGVYEGIVLLGSYSTEDLTPLGLDVLSIYGSEDRVMNVKKYQNYKSNLPDTFTEHIIDGGCHAGFGMYGTQEGDGIPSISSKEQIHTTAEAVATWIDS